MEHIRSWLKSFGLHETEIEVYICILRHPGAKVADIQRHTGLVRTTIYYTLAQLKTGGLLSENLQNNVKTYRAAGISTLKSKIESEITVQQNKLGQLEVLKPLFDILHTQPSDGSSFVARFEGAEPIKQAVEAALRCNSKRWHIIASRDNFLYRTSKKYQQYYLSERKRRGITAKTLWEPTDSAYVPSAEDVFYRNPRVLPNAFRNMFSALVILYDDTTLIIDPYAQKTAHAIHNPASTQLLRLLHNYVWSNATTLK